MRAQNVKHHKAPSVEDKKRILTKALINASTLLKLSRQELSAILGPSEPSLSRIFTKTNLIDPDSKEGQLGLLLLRLYRNLDILFGGNEKQYQLWLRSENKHLGDKPVLLMQTIEGLVLTVQYLDAMCGKN